MDVRSLQLVLTGSQLESLVLWKLHRNADTQRAASELWFQAIQTRLPITLRTDLGTIRTGRVDSTSAANTKISFIVPTRLGLDTTIRSETGPTIPIILAGEPIRSDQSADGWLRARFETS